MVGVSLHLTLGVSASLDAMLSKVLVPCGKLEKGDLLVALLPDPIPPKEKELYRYYYLLKHQRESGCSKSRLSMRTLIR
jgi:hypothetical protein